MSTPPPLLELPPSVFAALTRVAEANGTTPAAWIAACLPGWATAEAASSPAAPAEQKVAAANDQLDAHIVSLGHATGTDNAAIDADLIRAYADDHGAATAPPETGTRRRRIPGLDTGKVIIAPDFDALLLDEPLNGLEGR